MENLSWELSVLSRAVAYNNLSGAAAHVGISQPQLSRIIARLEGELGVSVLDRSAKRKSSFTPIAHRLAETYVKTARNLSGEIQRIVEGTEPKQINVGTLEGLMNLASSFSNKVLEKTSVRLLELNVYDLNQLEELYFRGDLDFVFTSREPGHKKFRYSKLMGYQALKRVEKDGGHQVMSSFEFASQPPKKRGAEDAKTVISNSLAIRRHWIESYGGTGVIPSPLKKPRDEQDTPVFLIGSDGLSPNLWQKVAADI